MAITNRERINKALELLKTGLGPFAEREFRSRLGDRSDQVLAQQLYGDTINVGKSMAELEVHALFKVMMGVWSEVYSFTLGPVGRSYVVETKEVRNKWAHQENFTGPDTERALDTIARLLQAVTAPEADEVEKMRSDLRRLVDDEQVRNEKRRAGGSLIDAVATGTVKPWREVVTPHDDVANGRYQQAEFAADLWQVHIGEGSDEYKDPAEFFRRTYLTESLKALLVSGVRRITGKGGDPVVQLQTNFGGGKTHSMLALYHLLSGVDATQLAGIDAVLAEAGVTQAPRARPVVLVGNRISPGRPITKRDGTVVRTLWGELAYQLGGVEAYARVREDDERATNPGDVLRELMVEYGPCLILVDEWVSYARQLHDQEDLPAGTFVTQFTFAQTLTESARLAGNCLLVVSLPASDTSGSPHTLGEDVEVGGIRGREALDRLRNVVGRVESSWRPATAEEGFEIVRRRLFTPLVDQAAYHQRDVTAAAFAELYRAHGNEFPRDCREVTYERRIQAAYPIHPEVFDRLYTEWSTLAKFQRTRGVLRLMAAVIHCLWERGDRSPLIMPSTIPMEDPRVQSELTRYLSDNWMPIIEKDVDGPTSLPTRIDNENTALGKLGATRRVARTIYLGSAPTASSANRGIEDQWVRLGCVVPGEAPAIFGDALRRLAGAATYLYHDGSRSWYDTQPTVTRLAEDLAERLKRDPDKALAELERRLKADLAKTGDFAGIHPLPRTGADVPDDRLARLVVLSPDYLYGKEPNSPAEVAAREILEKRGSGPRINRNTLVFLAADKTRYQDLEEAIRGYLAWDSIVADKTTLNLDPHQARQAEAQKMAADGKVTARLPEAYQWLLAPEQEDPRSAITWEATRLSGAEALAVRAARRLKSNEALLTSLGSTILRRHLDSVPLWRGDHVSVKQLADDFAQYLYLPRVARPEVLEKAMGDGLTLLTWRTETFAYAESYDETAGRYVGLRCGDAVLVDIDGTGLLVKPEVAARQQEVEARPPAPPTTVTPPGGPGGDTATVPPVLPGLGPVTVAINQVAPPKPALRRYHGTVTLDPQRVGLDASTIAKEVIAHLAGQVGAKVTVTLEIEATLADGASDHLVRTVTENGQTLKFTNHGFENE